MILPKFQLHIHVKEYSYENIKINLKNVYNNLDSNIILNIYYYYKLILWDGAITQELSSYFLWRKLNGPDLIPDHMICRAP